MYIFIWLYLGRHTVEILHNGQAIMGSPFFVEIYDPNKIRIEGTKTGRVNERMEFDSMYICSSQLSPSPYSYSFSTSWQCAELVAASSKAVVAGPAMA